MAECGHPHLVLVPLKAINHALPADNILELIDLTDITEVTNYSLRPLATALLQQGWHLRQARDISLDSTDQSRLQPVIIAVSPKARYSHITKPVGSHFIAKGCFGSVFRCTVEVPKCKYKHSETNVIKLLHTLGRNCVHRY